MNEKHINKVIYGSDVLIDLTSDTVTADKVLAGYTFHAADGSTKTGTSLFDVDSSAVTSVAAEVLSGKTFAKNGSVLTGTMPNIGAQTSAITTKAQQVVISHGYHDGSGKVSIDAIEQAKIIAENIKDGVVILGVTGNYTGFEGILATVCAVTPTVTSQTILPTDIGEYNYITQVNVAAIPYSEVENLAGGLTAQIATAV